MTDYLENIKQSINSGYLIKENGIIGIRLSEKDKKVHELQRQAYVNNKIESIIINCEEEVKRRVRRILNRSYKKNEYKFWDRIIINILLKKLWKKKDSI